MKINPIDAHPVVSVPLAARMGKCDGLPHACSCETDDLSCRTAASAAVAVEQCRAFIATLDQRDYTTPSAVMHGATIGQHVRHTIDHYAAALVAIAGGVIDYDRRERGTEIENDRAAAVHRLGHIAETIRGITAALSGTGVRVRVMIDSGTGEEAEHRSTLGRELAFAAHHAVHHHAMIAAIARDFGLDVPSGFGKAPSTLHHEAGFR